jgi:hypothetical protein
MCHTSHRPLPPLAALPFGCRRGLPASWPRQQSTADSLSTRWPREIPASDSLRGPAAPLVPQSLPANQLCHRRRASHRLWSGPRPSSSAASSPSQLPRKKNLQRFPSSPVGALRARSRRRSRLRRTRRSSAPRPRRVLYTFRNPKVRKCSQISYLGEPWDIPSDLNLIVRSELKNSDRDAGLSRSLRPLVFEPHRVGRV